MESHKGVKAFYARSRKEWRNWLEKNHLKETSIWLIIYKKDSGYATVTYDQAVDEALCFGWIDSKPNKRDEDSFYQFFAKRNPKSKWSVVNKNKVETLRASGLMEKEGLRMVEVALQTGTWTALDGVYNMEYPADLQEKLDMDPKASAFFSAFPVSVKRAILEWILSAKKGDTRMRRIEETVSLAAKNIRANQYRNNQ